MTPDPRDTDPLRVADDLPTKLSRSDRVRVWLATRLMRLVLALLREAAR